MTDSARGDKMIVRAEKWIEGIPRWYPNWMWSRLIRKAICTLQGEVDVHKTLGYDTREIEEWISEIEKLKDKAYRDNLIQRKQLGYDVDKRKIDYFR